MRFRESTPLRILMRMKLHRWIWALACASCATLPKQEPSDTVAIANVYARFVDVVNRHDWEAVAALHREDAVWEGAAGELGFRNEGRSAIRAWLIGNVPKLTVVHYLSGPPMVRVIAPGRAEATVSVTELLRIESTGELRQLFGVYTDELIRDEGGWAFAHRRFKLHHAAPLVLH
jgi:ketosteroid isomerase-like protein